MHWKGDWKGACQGACNIICIRNLIGSEPQYDVPELREISSCPSFSVVPGEYNANTPCMSRVVGLDSENWGLLTQTNNSWESTRHGPQHLYILSSMANAEGSAYRFFVYSLLWNEPCWWNPSYSLTVFSPSGKLVQIEHALAAVSQGTTSLGIKGACFPPGTRSV